MYIIWDVVAQIVVVKLEGEELVEVGVENVELIVVKHTKDALNIVVADVSPKLVDAAVKFRH